MDDNNQEVYPMAPTHGRAKNDVESAAWQFEVLRQSKCIPPTQLPHLTSDSMPKSLSRT